MFSFTKSLKREKKTRKIMLNNKQNNNSGKNFK